MFEVLELVASTISVWIATRRARRQLEAGLGRKVGDEELMSIRSWMAVPTIAQAPTGGSAGFSTVRSRSCSNRILRRELHPHHLSRESVLWAAAGIPDDGMPQPDPDVSADAATRVDRFLESQGWADGR